MGFDTDTLTVIGFIIGAIVAGLIAFVYLTSRYRKAADAEKDKYIKALEGRNTFLEGDQQRRDLADAVQKKKVDRLCIEVSFLKDLVLGRCQRSENDGHGGCVHCTLGMAYGKAEGITG